jgi:DNA transformation protein and related proteins
MPKAPHPLADYIVDQLRDWAPVAVRRLFGGWGIYRGPVMFGLIARDAIYFRVDEANRPDYRAAATKPFLHTARKRAGATESGAKPFTYTMPSGKTIEMAYYEVPADILENVEELSQWAAKAETAAIRAKSTKIKAKAKKPVTRPAQKRGGK